MTLPLAAIYARVSTDLQDTANSIDRQVTNCRSFALNQGFEVAEEHIYTDKAFSGSTQIGRPGFQTILDKIRGSGIPPFEVVIVDEDSRLDRGGALRSICEEFEFRNIRVFSADGGTELTDERHRLLCHVKAGMNEEYIRETSRRTRDGLRTKFLNGFHTGGWLFGYRFQRVWPEKIALADREKANALGTRIEINQEQAAVVVRIYQMRADGMGYKQIAHTLNREGIPKPNPKKGKGWDSTTIRSMLENPKYRGEWYWNRVKWKKKPERLLSETERARARATGSLPRKCVPNGDDALVGGDREELRIVSDDLWEAVQARFKKNAANGGRKVPRHLFSGLLRCSCGGMITVRSSVNGRPDLTKLACSWNRRRGPSVCQNSLVIRQDTLAKVVLPYIREQLLQPEAIEYALQRINERLAEEARHHKPDERRKEIQSALEPVEQEIANLVAALGSGCDIEAVREALQAKNAHRDQLKAELSRLEQAAKPRWLTKWSREAIVARLDHLWADLHSTDIARARTLLGKLMGPSSVELAEDGKAWRIHCAANPLVLFVGDRIESFNGSGGGI